MATENDEDILELTDQIIEETEEGAESVAEPLDEIEYPETLDDDGSEEVQNKGLLKLLRDQLKDKNRQITDLQARGNAPKLQRIAEPDLWEDCEGDPDKYKAALLTWQDNERKVDAQESAQTTEQDKVRETWQGELNTYKAEAAKLGPTFQESEDAVVAALTAAQQTTIVMAAKHPALFIKALGKSPNRLAQISQITNPIKLAAEVARIEGTRTMGRKEPANIDTPVRGSAPLAPIAKNAKLDAEIKKAQETGNITPELRAARKAQEAKAA